MAGAWDQFHYNIHGRDVGLIPQLDGSAFGGENCACATAAMHILSESQGKKPHGATGPWPPNGRIFRQLSGDDSGGLLASLVDATSNRWYDVDPDFVIVPSARVIAKLRAGYGATQLRWEGPIADAGFRGSPGFRENHSSYLSEAAGQGNLIKGKDCNPLYDARRIGIPNGPQWVPWRSIVRASELLDIGPTRLIDRYGAGMMYVGFTRVPYRPTAPISHISYSVAFGAGSFYTYKVVNGQIVDRDPLKFSGPTSAPCEAPHRVLWPGHVAMRLVRVSKGALAGEYVAVPQGSVRLLEKEMAA